MTLTVWSSSRYTFPLPDGHRFPVAKYAMLREKVIAEGVVAAELRRLGFPWSPALVERSYRAVGGTVEAARHALEQGIAMNLAGGTHHACPDQGEGFCVFNDVAVADVANRVDDANDLLLRQRSERGVELGEIAADELEGHGRDARVRVNVDGQAYVCARANGTAPRSAGCG